MKRAHARSQTDAAHRYRALGQLGIGGMGTVFEAVDLTSGGRVALKFAHARGTSRRGAVRQVVAEAAAMTLAQSRHICRFVEVSTLYDQPCLVMERLVGQTLEARMARGRCSMSLILDVAIQLADALAAVHRAGLVHQDIKPANVFLTSAGIVKLLDFGLAVPAGTQHSGGKTSSSVLGTASYIAPERILRRPADPRSDLFSLGAVLFQLVTGRPPFAGGSPSEVIFNVLDAKPAPVRESAPDCPAAFDWITQKLLAKRPADRFQSAAALKQALQPLRQARAGSARCVKVAPGLRTSPARTAPGRGGRPAVRAVPA